MILYYNFLLFTGCWPMDILDGLTAANAAHLDFFENRSLLGRLHSYKLSFAKDFKKLTF